MNRPSSKIARHFNHRDIETAEKAEPDKLRHLAQMDVDIVHLAGIDALAAGGIGLIGQPEIDPISACERAIEFGGRRSPRPDADFKGFSRRVERADACRERSGNCFWISRAGKAAHAHICASGNKRRCLGSRHDLGFERRTKHARFRSRSAPFPLSIAFAGEAEIMLRCSKIQARGYG